MYWQFGSARRNISPRGAGSTASWKRVDLAGRAKKRKVAIHSASTMRALTLPSATITSPGFFEGLPDNSRAPQTKFALSHSPSSSLPRRPSKTPTCMPHMPLVHAIVPSALNPQKGCAANARFCSHSGAKQTCLQADGRQQTNSGVFLNQLAVTTKSTGTPPLSNKNDLDLCAHYASLLPCTSFPLLFLTGAHLGMLMSISIATAAQIPPSERHYASRLAGAASEHYSS